MKNERLQNELLIALNGNTSLLNQILEEIISLDEKQKDILCDVIKAENELLFFSENHYSETKIQKDKFDYKTSKEISRIIGLIYPPLSLENVGFSMISQKVEAQEIFES